jgi:flagellar protein FlaJ
MIKREYAKQAYKELKDIVPYFKPLFLPMRKYLPIIGWGISINEYVAIALLISICSMVVAYSIGYSLAYLVLNQLIPSLIIGLSFSLFGFVITLLIMAYLPRYQYISLGSKIDTELPYVIAHFATIADTGVSVKNMIKILATFEEFKTMNTRFKDIYRSVELFGMNIFSALEREAKLTPSKKWSEILYGVISIIKTGGNLRDYLERLADKLLEEKRMKEEQFIDTLNLMTEIYIVIFVVVPISVIIGAAIMGMIGMGSDMFAAVGGMDVLIKVFVYFIMPFTALMFVLLIYLLRPSDI